MNTIIASCLRAIPRFFAIFSKNPVYLTTFKDNDIWYGRDLLSLKPVTVITALKSRYYSWSYADVPIFIIVHLKLKDVPGVPKLLSYSLRSDNRMWVIMEKPRNFQP